ncbi:MAG TPA: hypothetical protein VFW44_05175 [Bryobacteraceae bacterium]|nr:hypothetical protein [Bryobacteraceae bacterium]
MSKLTRRELAAALSTGAISAPALLRAQGQPAPNDELTASRAELREESGQLDRFPLPMAAEPATTFKP